MAQHRTTHPAQPVLASYLAERHKSKQPPPTPEEVRRQLGWNLLPNNRR